MVPVTENVPSSYRTENVPLALASHIAPAQLKGLSGSSVSGTMIVGLPDTLVYVVSNVRCAGTFPGPKS